MIVFFRKKNIFINKIDFILVNYNYYYNRNKNLKLYFVNKKNVGLCACNLG